MQTQVAVERILGQGRQPFSVLKSLLAQEEATVTAALDQLSPTATKPPDLAGLLGISAGGPCCVCMCSMSAQVPLVLSGVRGCDR